MNDQSLGDNAAQAQPAAPSNTMTPFGDPNATTPPPAARQWTIEDILDTAKLPEDHAAICLRADLQAEYDQAILELSGLVDAKGHLIVDDERSAGEQSNAARAAELSDRLTAVRTKMAKHMWFPLFRGLSGDALKEFNGQHRPKGEAPDMTEYNTLLIAECSIASASGPKLTVDDVRALRTKLGSNALGELATTANKVCTQGGVDFPQLPAGLQRLKQQ